MTCAEKLGMSLILVAQLGLGTACGGAATSGTGPGGDGGTKPTYACTGATPANAVLCAGTDAGLTSDTARVVTGSLCTATACSYVCYSGYVLEAGACVSLPSGSAAHFTDNADGTITVTDLYGSTTWLQDANCTETEGGVARPGGKVSFPQAMAWSGGLASGACGLRDGSAVGDWHLPTQGQLMRLGVELGVANPFSNMQSGLYWSSWTYWADKAGAVDMFNGTYFDYPKTDLYYVWPVRL
jgi:hypothetical protein